MRPIILPYLAILLIFASCARSNFPLQKTKFEGLALTPPMGWNSWNNFQENINENLVEGMADAMISSGMKDAGYSYLVLDDGWMAKERDASGNLVPDPIKFPHGIKVIADYVHSKGLKFGLYNCAGTLTCGGYPGSRGHEYQDARNYALWTVDYLKIDWCNTQGINAEEEYGTLSKALRTAGRPIILSLCEWGQNQPWKWAAPVGELWRTTSDITACFDCENKFVGYSNYGIMRIADLQKGLNGFAGPGRWNDPDMLEVGRGMSVAEDRTHFSLWCMLAAPLIAGNDLRNMSAETTGILADKEVIAVDQDLMGIEGIEFSFRDSVECWARPLQNKSWAFCFVNRASTEKAFSFDWKAVSVDVGVEYRPGAGASTGMADQRIDFQSSTYNLYDLWQKKGIGTTSSPLNVVIPVHDVVFLKLTQTN
jgi:alpha-galactosidase